jgi:hypothetical protein
MTRAPHDVCIFSHGRDTAMNIGGSNLYATVERHQFLLFDSAPLDHFSAHPSSHERGIAAASRVICPRRRRRHSPTLRLSLRDRIVRRDPRVGLWRTLEVKTMPGRDGEYLILGAVA